MSDISRSAVNHLSLTRPLGGAPALMITSDRVCLNLSQDHGSALRAAAALHLRRLQLQVGLQAGHRGQSNTHSVSHTTAEVHCIEYLCDLIQYLTVS